MLGFPAKFEELLFKAFVCGLELLNQLPEAFLFVAVLIAVEPSGELAFPLIKLFPETSLSSRMLPPLACDALFLD